MKKRIFAFITAVLMSANTVLAEISVGAAADFASVILSC